MRSGEVYHFFVLMLLIVSCGDKINYHCIPSDWVYSIVQHNDSIYWSTNTGKILRLSLAVPDSVRQIGCDHFYPIRSFSFKKNGDLYASSYQTGIHRVTEDSLLPCTKMWRMAWAMKTDTADTVWLAGRDGVFRQYDDTLLRFSNLSQAYDIGFYGNKIAVAHQKGITLFNRETETADTTLCKDVICWSIDIYDTLLIGGGVETCLLYNGFSGTSFRLTPEHNICWGAVLDSTGTVFLATQKGLFRIVPAGRRPECIGFRGRCIKSLAIDSTGRLWIGRYFAL